MIVDYIGMERCDILYFLLYVGRKLGKSILAADNSLSGDLFRIFKQEGDDTYAHINKLTIVRNIIPAEQAMQHYDITFIYQGLDVHYKEKRDVTILAPSVVKTEWERLKENGMDAGAFEESRIYCILRDMTSKKVSVNAFAQEFGVTGAEGLEQYMSETDYTNYIGLTHNRAAYPVSHGEIYEIVLTLAGQLYGTDAKTIKKLMKKDSMDRRRQVW